MPSCIVESTRSFFCNSENHFVEFLKSTEGQDKLLKFAAEGIFPLISEIAKEAGASESTMDGLNTAHAGVKITRDVTAFLNIFRGTIPMIVNKVRQIWALIIGLKNNPAGGVPLKKNYENRDERTDRYNQNAIHRTEMLLKLGENAGGMIGALTYAAGFGIAKPAATLRKYWGVNTDVGNKIADSFSYLMCANHIGGVIESSFGLAYQFQAYERASVDQNNNIDNVNEAFNKAVLEKALSLVEKLLELMNDTCVFLRNIAPVGLRIALGLTINGLALYRVWRHTA